MALPLLIGSVYLATGLRESWPELFTILILHIAISPITSAAAFTALIGLDVAFSLLTLILANTVTPVTTLGISYLFLGTAMISPLELGLKLAFFFIASGTAAWAIRRLAGQPWIERQKEPLDGLNVIAVFVFAIAAMGSVAAVHGRSRFRAGATASFHPHRRADRPDAAGVLVGRSSSASWSASSPAAATRLVGRDRATLPPVACSISPVHPDLHISGPAAAAGADERR